MGLFLGRLASDWAGLLCCSDQLDRSYAGNASSASKSAEKVQDRADRAVLLHAHREKQQPCEQFVFRDFTFAPTLSAGVCARGVASLLLMSIRGSRAWQRCPAWHVTQPALAKYVMLLSLLEMPSLVSSARRELVDRATVPSCDRSPVLLTWPRSALKMRCSHRICFLQSLALLPLKVISMFMHCTPPR